MKVSHTSNHSIMTISMTLIIKRIYHYPLKVIFKYKIQQKSYIMINHDKSLSHRENLLFLKK